MGKASITKHGKRRLKTRTNKNNSNAEQFADRALEYGVNWLDTDEGSELHEYLKKLHSKSKFEKKLDFDNIRIYGHNVFIFNKKILITVLNLPKNLIKDAEELQSIKKKEREAKHKNKDDEPRVISGKQLYEDYINSKNAEYEKVDVIKEITTTIKETSKLPYDKIYAEDTKDSATNGSIENSKISEETQRRIDDANSIIESEIVNGTIKALSLAVSREVLYTYDRDFYSIVNNDFLHTLIKGISIKLSEEILENLFNDLEYNHSVDELVDEIESMKFKTSLYNRLSTFGNELKAYRNRVKSFGQGEYNKMKRAAANLAVEAADNIIVSKAEEVDSIENMISNL